MKDSFSPPPLAGWPPLAGNPLPPKLCVAKQAALWSCVCVIVDDPPAWLPLPAWHENVMDGWGARPLRWLSVLISKSVGQLGKKLWSKLQGFAHSTANWSLHLTTQVCPATSSCEEMATTACVLLYLTTSSVCPVHVHAHVPLVDVCCPPLARPSSELLFRFRTERHSVGILSVQIQTAVMGGWIIPSRILWLLDHQGRIDTSGQTTFAKYVGSTGCDSEWCYKHKGVIVQSPGKIPSVAFAQDTALSLTVFVCTGTSYTDLPWFEIGGNEGRVCAV